MNKQLLIIVIFLILLIVNLSGCQENTGSDDEMQNFQDNNNSNALDGDDLFKSACQAAISDYPEWTKSSSDIISWEDNIDKIFNYRNSPEEPSIGLSSPVSSYETLVDMDFIGINEIIYVKTLDDKWYICLLILEGMNIHDNSMIYEKTGSISSIDISPIKNNEFIVFYTTDNNAFLEYLNVTDQVEKNLFETSSASSNVHKLAVSTAGSYVYLLYDSTLRIFDVASKVKLDEITSVESVVWIGNSHLVYSTSDATYIYEIENKESNQLSMINSVSDLCFNPNNNGVLAYTEQNTAKVINCQTRQILASKQNMQIMTFAKEETIIYGQDNSFGFWRFNNDWTVHLSKGFSNYATVWKRY